MSDGREEREEREKRCELEEREDREDRLNHDFDDPWKPERDESKIHASWIHAELLFSLGWT